MHAELLKLGITISERTGSGWMPRRGNPTPPTWRSFLENHVRDIVSVDFFTVSTATFQVLFGLLVLAHDRRRVVHFNVTASPTVHWTARQIVEAFPRESAPRHLLRDRDSILGDVFRSRVRGMGIEEVLIAHRSPWQSPFVERLVGSKGRECPDHVFVGKPQALRGRQATGSCREVGRACGAAPSPPG